MKRAEQIAWAALAGLATVAVILLTGGFLRHFTAFWAGTMLVSGEALVVGIAAWGLMLARQARELGDLPSASGMGFRMGAADDAAAGGLSAERERGEEKGAEVGTLDIGFQRVVVGSTGAVMVILGVLAGYLMYAGYAWGRAHPDKTMPIVGSYADAVDALHGAAAGLDSVGVLIGLSSAALYGVFYFLTRRRRGERDDVSMEAVRGNFSLGVVGMGALAVATVLAYFQVSYASELAAGVMAFVMVLQGLELLVNSLRSYSGIEELDEEAVDLQSMPLVPMMGSVWLGGLRLLFAQSVGISTKEARERGVIARMMPRVLVAVALIAIGISCLRVVAPGEVAVRERLGWAPMEADGRLAPAAILYPGLHLSMPWPIDTLRYIPTEQLQETDVGQELHAPKDWKNVDFEFWTIRDMNTSEGEQNDLFLTGDPSSDQQGASKSAPQMLETYVQVRWRVADPGLFYNALSHSDFFAKAGQGTTTLPIYEEIVQQCASYAVTRTFAIHTLDQIMVDDRQKAEDQCRGILQEKLDDLKSGIRVDYLTIKDLHPPYWKPDQPTRDPKVPQMGGTIQFQGNQLVLGDDGRARIDRGPASAFENVISMREFGQQMIDLAKGQAEQQRNDAIGYKSQTVADAERDSIQKVAEAKGDAERVTEMTSKLADLSPQQRQFELQLKEQQLLYATVKDMFGPVIKVVIDPAVKDVEIWQSNGSPATTVRPPQ